MIACGDDKKQTVEDVIATSNAEIIKRKTCFLMEEQQVFY